MARYWVGGTGYWDATTTTHWSATSGGAGGASVPTSTDDVIFDLHSNEPDDTAYTCILYSDSPKLHCKNLDVSFIGTTQVSINGTNLWISGNINLSGGSAQVVWNNNGIYFDAISGIQTITTNGVVVMAPVVLYAQGITTTTLRLLDTLTTTDLITASNYGGGVVTLDFNNNNISVGSMILSDNTTTLLGTGIIEITGEGIIFQTGVSAVVTPSTSTIKFTNTGNNYISISGNGITFNNIWFSRGASTGDIIINGNGNTFNNFKDDGTEAHTIKFTDGIDQNITSLTVNGSTGKLITLTGTGTAGWKISDTAGINAVSYVNISYSTAEGGAVFNADNSTNGGNNIGWTFYHYLNMTVGAFTLTSIDTIIKSTRSLIVSVRTFALTGISNILKKGLGMVAQGINFTFTGIDNIFTSSRKLITTVGQFILTGINNILYAGVPYPMATTAGEFILTGIDNILRTTPRLFAEVGNFILTGYNIIVKGQGSWIWRNMDKHPVTFINKTKNVLT